MREVEGSSLELPHFRWPIIVIIIFTPYILILKKEGDPSLLVVGAELVVGVVSCVSC